MKKQRKKLMLSKDTVRDLKLGSIQGGTIYQTQTCGFTCTEDPSV